MIRKYKLFLNIILLSSFVFFSCEEKTDWNYAPDENGTLVVESIITDQYQNQEVLLSLSRDNINDLQLPASNAEIRLTSKGKSVVFDEILSQPGRYVSEIPFSAKLNQVYQLEINWKEEKYAAQNYMVQVTPLTEISFKPEGTDSLSLNFVAQQYSPHEQAMYEIDIDWSHLVNSDSAKAKLFYFTFNTIDVNEIFKPAKDNIKFPKGSVIIEKKYSLNPEMANYFRSMLMEIEWQGGIFDETPSSLPTNISNGGLGLFGVSAVLSDTLIAK